MTHVSTLGRGVARGRAGTLVWVVVSVFVLGAPDLRRAAVAGLGVAAAVAVVAELARLR